MFQKRKITLIDPSFHGRARSYLLQSVLAAIALGVILLLETGVSSAGITASIASSVFLVFVVPHSVASTTRRVVGGHVVAVIIGVSAFGILNLIVDNPAEISGQTFALAGAISVGVAILMMALTNTEHPPPQPEPRSASLPLAPAFTPYSSSSAQWSFLRPSDSRYVAG